MNTTNKTKQSQHLHGEFNDATLWTAQRLPVHYSATGGAHAVTYCKTADMLASGFQHQSSCGRGTEPLYTHPFISASSLIMQTGRPVFNIQPLAFTTAMAALLPVGWTVTHWTVTQNASLTRHQECPCSFQGPHTTASLASTGAGRPPLPGGMVAMAGSPSPNGLATAPSLTQGLATPDRRRIHRVRHIESDCSSSSRAPCSGRPVTAHPALARQCMHLP